MSPYTQGKETHRGTGKETSQVAARMDKDDNQEEQDGACLTSSS